MIRMLIGIGLLLNTFVLIAQKPRPFLFNECGFYVNDAIPVSSRYAIEGHAGVGLAAYHSYRLHKQLQPVLGLEYQYTRFSVNELYHDKPYSDVRFRYHLIRIPFSLRMHIGKTHSLFFEPGIYAVAPFAHAHTVVVNNGSAGQANEYTVTASFPSKPGAGCSFGLGAQFPTKNGHLLVKVEGCWGLGSVLLAAGNPNESRIFYSSAFKAGMIYQFATRQNRLF